MPLQLSELAMAKDIIKETNLKKFSNVYSKTYNKNIQNSSKKVDSRWYMPTVGIYDKIFSLLISRFLTYCNSTKNLRNYAFDC